MVCDFTLFLPYITFSPITSVNVWKKFRVLTFSIVQLSSQTGPYIPVAKFFAKILPLLEVLPPTSSIAITATKNNKLVLDHWGFHIFLNNLCWIFNTLILVFMPFYCLQPLLQLLSKFLFLFNGKWEGAIWDKTDKNEQK